MPEIKEEIPEGRRNTEMILVRMLKKHRSWVDVVDITAALWRVGFIADSIEEECNRNRGRIGGGENTSSEQLLKKSP